MVEMCQVVGIRDQLVTLLLPLVEHVLNVFLIHFQDRYAPLRFFLSFLSFVSSEKGWLWKYVEAQC